MAPRLCYNGVVKKLNQKIGLVLSGGGTRGLAHIGVLKVLQARRLRFDAIAGCSMGAIVGAALAAGRTPAEMEKFVMTQKLFRFLQWPLSALGLSNTQKLEQSISDFLGVKTFEELQIPLFINATNLTTRQTVVYAHGPILPAIRASISIPGIFAPVQTKAGFLVDGGVLDQNPFSILPPEIKKFVMVNCSPPETVKVGEKRNVITMMRAAITIMENEITHLRLCNVDPRRYVFIEPSLSGHLLFETETAFRRLIRKGERAAKKASIPSKFRQ